MKYMPHIVTASPTMNILHKNSTSAAGNKPIVARHYLPEFIVYIRVPFWCCKFFGLLQMYNAMCPPLQQHAEQFHCLKNLLCSSYSSPPFTEILGTTDLFLVSVVLPLPEDCVRLTFEQQGFKLIGSTYTQIFSSSKYHETTTSDSRMQNHGRGGLTIVIVSRFSTVRGSASLTLALFKG